MLGQIGEFKEYAAERGLELVPSSVTQTLSEDELKNILPEYDGWIIGDDPATRAVFEAGIKGRLRAAVKWGVGVDNVDFNACRDLGIPIDNTPGMFGEEVADVALAYVIGLARHLFFIDRNIRTENAWPKPAGISLAGRTAGVVGLGDIGRNLATRLIACGMNVIAYDPGVQGDGGVRGIVRDDWPERIAEVDVLVFTCALNDANRYMLNASVINQIKSSTYVVNVARGALIDEGALTRALMTGEVAGAALDVFEEEPLSTISPLRQSDRCILGSHNGSNTVGAVFRTSRACVDQITALLDPPGSIT
jgi:D-3-phosphoglycerate dehydrogenase